MRRERLEWVANAVLFQVCWIAFVGGAGRGWWWAGFPLLLAFAVWQLAISRWPRSDLLLMLIAAALGFAMDSALLRGGLLQYAAPVPWTDLAPAWMVGLWIGFALTLNHSMAFLKRRLVSAALLGALAGPFAYWVAASAWNAVEILTPQWHALLALALAWGAITPLLAVLAARLALREADARHAQPA